MTHDNEFYVTLKLVTGENVIASLESEDDDYATLKYPIVIKTMHVMQNNSMVERLAASPLCPFSDEIYYTIDKRNILFIKELHQSMLPKYLDVVNDTSTKEEVPRDIVEGHPDSVEELDSRINSLEQILQKAKQRTKEERKEEDRFFIEGNETLN